MSTTSEIYKPNNSKFLSELEDSQVRIGFQAPPFEGKTYAALTWPNPVIASFDGKVTAHLHRNDVPILPFYNPGYVDSLVRRESSAFKPNRKDALTKFLDTEGQKLSHEQTLILDGCGGIETAFHEWYKDREDALARTKKGDIDKFVQWNLKKDYFDELWNAVRSLKCDVIFICWEQVDRSEDGSLNGKIKPILTGQAGDRLGGNFTDWFAVMAISKPSGQEQRQKLKDWAKISDSTLEEWISSTPSDYQAIHLFQTQDDNLRSCGSSSLHGCPKYIVANYTTFNKYRK